MKKTNREKGLSTPQSLLFGYLSPEQQNYVKPILRDLKKPAQEELCWALLDYLENGDIVLPFDFLLSTLFLYLTRAGREMPDDPTDRRILRPLKVQQEPIKF